MQSTSEILLGLLLTWGVGLSPAIFVRYWWKRAPLRPWPATAIAAITCLLFAVTFMAVRASMGGEEHISLAWLLVFVVSRGIMVNGYKDHIVGKLLAIVRNPASDEARRKWAKEQMIRLGVFPEPATATPQAVSADPPKASPFLAKARALWPPSTNSIRWAAWLFAALLCLNLLLMVSGQRLLVDEQVLEPGEGYDWEDWTLGNDDRPVLLCRYWTGRSIKPRTEWYGIGYGELDECPIVSDAAMDRRF